MYTRDQKNFLTISKKLLHKKNYPTIIGVQDIVYEALFLAFAESVFFHISACFFRKYFWNKLSL